VQVTQIEQRDSLKLLKSRRQWSQLYYSAVVGVTNHNEQNFFTP
jgi:hypothetical protein